VYVIRFQRLALKPRLFVADNFVGSKKPKTLLEVARRITGSHVDAPGTLKHDETGTFFEMPADCNRVVTVAARMRASFGFANGIGDTMRYRGYGLGESHPLHSDRYEIEGHFLVVTAMLCLMAPSDGGETHFPNRYRRQYFCSRNRDGLPFGSITSKMRRSIVMPFMRRSQSKRAPKSR
jgi:hypothetical protein